MSRADQRTLSFLNIRILNKLCMTYGIGESRFFFTLRRLCELSLNELMIHQRVNY